MIFLDWLIFETLTMNSLIVAYMSFKTASIDAGMSNPILKREKL